MVNYFLITNMELDCVMLYIMVSLDDHQGREHVTQSRPLLMGPRNFAPVDNFVIGQLSPRLKIQSLQRHGWILCPSTICLMSCPSASLLIDLCGFRSKDIVPGGSLE